MWNNFDDYYFRLWLNSSTQVVDLSGVIYTVYKYTIYQQMITWLLLTLCLDS